VHAPYEGGSGALRNSSTYSFATVEFNEPREVQLKLNLIAASFSVILLKLYKLKDFLQ
jgi:hypothetical protein